MLSLVHGLGLYLQPSFWKGQGRGLPWVRGQGMGGRGVRYVWYRIRILRFEEMLPKSGFFEQLELYFKKT